MIALIADPDFGLVPSSCEHTIEVFDAVGIRLEYDGKEGPWLLSGHFLGRFDDFYTITDRHTGTSFAVDASFYSTTFNLAVVVAHVEIDGKEVAVTGHPTPGFASSAFSTRLGIMWHLGLLPEDYDVWDGRDTSGASAWTGQPAPTMTGEKHASAARWAHVVDTVDARWRLVRQPLSQLVFDERRRGVGEGS